jgi:lipoprotein-anchoring transpeptidase ErfK/SrfK
MNSTRLRTLLGIVAATALVSGLGTGAAEATPTYPKPGQTSVRVLELESRLVKAGALKNTYVSGHYGARTVAGVRAYQTSALLPVTGTVDAATWQPLVTATGKFDATAIPGIDKRCKTSGRVICLDKTRGKLFYVKNRRVLQVMDARFGCKRTHTREGKFRVYRKSKHHVSSIYHTKMPYAMFFSRGEAVHYSSDYARGKGSCSHGCANIKDKKGLAWLYRTIKIGDRVVVYRS